MKSTHQSSAATMANPQVNGVDTTELTETVKAIQADPGLGACHFRATNKWLSGNHNRSTVTGFYGARQEIGHAQTFTMDADEPAILAGHDQGGQSGGAPVACAGVVSHHQHGGACGRARD